MSYLRTKLGAKDTVHLCFRGEEEVDFEMRRISEADAIEVFMAAGLRPLEGYPGARNKWKAQCLVCNHVYAPNFYSIKSGKRCPNCFRIWQAEDQRKKASAIALITCNSLKYELLSQYVNAKTQVDLRCLICGQIVRTTMDILQSGGKKCDCRKVARKLLSVYRPDIYAEIDWLNLSDIKPEKIGTGTRKSIAWICVNKAHRFETSPANRIRNNGACPVCTGVTPEPGRNDLKTLYPRISSEFLKDPAGINDPSSVFPKSNLSFVWKCSSNEKHIWKASIQNRVEGTGCPYCSNKKVLEGDNDLATLHPQLALEWDKTKNSKLHPAQVTPGSNRPVYWMCKEGHSWRATVNSRARRGRGCLKCSKFEPGRNDLGTLGRPNLLSEFDSDRNGVMVSHLGVSSTNKYWWLCSLCGESFQASVLNRHFNGTGCPSCASTGYSALKASTLYFIENRNLGSRKIGKTNTSNTHDRVGKFKSRGWVVIKIWERAEGRSVDYVESALLNWIRTEKGLPQHLDKDSMRGMAGETETFSIEGVANNEVIDMGDLLLKVWDQSEGVTNA